MIQNLRISYGWTRLRAFDEKMPGPDYGAESPRRVIPNPSAPLRAGSVRNQILWHTAQLGGFLTALGMTSTELGPPGAALLCWHGTQDKDEDECNARA